jgi:hypothetical protein
MHDTVGVGTAKLGFGFSHEGAVWDSLLGDGSTEAEAIFFGDKMGWAFGVGVR